MQTHKTHDRRPLLILLALSLTLATPFLLRRDGAPAPDHYDRRLVILSPHQEHVRQEFGAAFARHWRASTGETVYVDWRLPGGSSEITLFLRSEYSSAFRHFWEARLGRSWTVEVATAFADPKIPATSGQTAGLARRTFLDSGVGIGIDLLFGGGSYDFQQFAEAGYLVAGSDQPPSGGRGIARRHPEWFSEAVIPARYGGEPLRDPEHRWIGVALARFGLLYNKDVFNRLRLRPPDCWHDLAAPDLLGQIAMADPSKSGSVGKAFELMLQEQMHRAVARIGAERPGLPPAAVENQAVRAGWEAGLHMIQAMSGNARYFSDSASRIVQEVARGDAAAGMAIDSYGRAAEENLRKADGRSRVAFVAPIAGSSLSADPIGLLRGAPEPELATAFMEFVLSIPGQRLWAYRPGTPGGPSTHALRRSPIRRDFYVEANRGAMSDPDDEPYLSSAGFVYRPEWTGPLFGALRFLIRVICVDTHEELQAAWEMLASRGFPPGALAAFHDLRGIGYDEVAAEIVPVLKARDKVKEVALARGLADEFRTRYRRAAALAAAATRP